MAQGDPHIVRGSVGGNSTVTINVPSGETWVARAYGNTYLCRPGYPAVNSGNISWIKMQDNGRTPDQAFDVRPLFDANNEPQIENTKCSTTGYYLSADEL